MPKVSILIPTYNQPQFVKECIESILSQTFTDYEIIVTDDSTNTETEEMIRSNGYKVIYVKNETSLGSPKNWNKALEYAAGDYIKFLHHDDSFAEKDSLECFVKALDENPDADFAFSESIHVNDKKEVSGVYSPAKYVKAIRKDFYCLFFANKIGAPSITIYRKNSFKFDEKMKWLVDKDFYIKCFEKNKNFVFIEKPLVNILVDSEKKVTHECVGNKEIEVFEEMYLYTKIKDYIKYSFYQKLNTLRWLAKLGVFSVEELKSLCPGCEIPDFLIKYMKLPFLMKILAGGI